MSRFLGENHLMTFFDVFSRNFKHINFCEKCFCDSLKWQNKYQIELNLHNNKIGNLLQN
jgi:hypothetical protein